MGQPSALQSRIRQWIDGVEVVEATEVSMAQPRPGGYKFGIAGAIGSFEGQAAATVEIGFAQVEGKSQFEIFASGLKNFYYVFTKGSSKFAMTNCRLGPASMRGNYESGDTTCSLSIMGVGPLQIA